MDNYCRIFVAFVFFSSRRRHTRLQGDWSSDVCSSDLTFFFKADLEVSLHRILDGRPQLKYFEAGMDLRLSTDPYESFRIFQGRILELYLAMSREFGFEIIDANQAVEAQQAVVRQLVSSRIDLESFKRNGGGRPARVRGQLKS